MTNEPSTPSAFDIRKQPWEPVMVSGVCIGVGRQDQNGIYQMLCNSILPENEDHDELQKVLWDMEVICHAMNKLANIATSNK